MRNGLNISGVSELVHEIQVKPVEALIRFATEADMRPGSTGVAVRTAHHGTIRMARGFTVDIDDPRGTSDALTCYESALAALGVCVLITHVFGFSTRGVSLSDLSVQVTGEIDPPDAGSADAAPIARIRYRVDVDCDGDVDAEMLQKVSGFVTCFSPNHRAFVDAAGFAATGRVRRSDGTTHSFGVPFAEWEEPGAPVADQPMTVQARLQWEYATQTSVSGTTVAGDVERSAVPALIIDQPKQMVGIDKGPNPQELLLSAISGDVLSRLRTLAADRDIVVSDATLRSRGQLDIRGMMNVSKDSPARFHDLAFDVDLTSDAPPTEVERLVRDALHSSAVLRTLQAPNTISVELTRQGEPICSFDACTAQAEALVEEMVRQLAEAAAREGS